MGWLGRTGPAAPQRPCIDPNDETCTAQSCPDINADLFSFSRDVLSFLDPEASDDFPPAPPSFITPNFFEPWFETVNDNQVLGELFREWITSGHHYASTASIGKVVDEGLKVIGTEGLYVADASVLPTTPRINAMATVLMVGRIAGLKFLEERG